MSMFENSVITNAGMAMLNQWAGGGTLTIDGAKAGSGTVAAASLPSQTALVNVVQEPPISKYSAGSDKMEFSVQFGPATSQYTMKQVGIYAHIDSGSSTLIAIYQDEDGVTIPAQSDIPDFVYTLHAVISIGAANTLTVTVDQSAAATMEDIAELEDSIEELDSAMGYASRFVIVQTGEPVVTNGKIWLRPLAN